MVFIGALGQGVHWKNWHHILNGYMRKALFSQQEIFRCFKYMTWCGLVLIHYRIHSKSFIRAKSVLWPDQLCNYNGVTSGECIIIFSSYCRRYFLNVRGKGFYPPSNCEIRWMMPNITVNQNEIRCSPC